MVNAVLSEMQIPYVDTSITTEAEKTEYTLPDDILDQKIKVWFQRTTTTDHNLWIEHFDWYIAETATGTAKKLVFRTQPQEPWNVKLEYWTPHPALYAITDKLAESININRLTAEAALRCMIWKRAQKANVDPILDSRVQELMARVQALKMRYPNKRPGVKLATLGKVDNFDYEGIDRDI
jgi:hypothetical protein